MYRDLSTCSRQHIFAAAMVLLALSIPDFADRRARLAASSEMLVCRSPRAAITATNEGTNIPPQHHERHGTYVS
jgi:hypothetical protein